MFPLFFMGMLGADWFTKLLNGTSNNTNNMTKKWIGFLPNVSLLDTINVYEQGALNRFTEVAHIPKGDNRITFGIGTVSIYNANSTYVRSVKYGDTVTKVKSEMGYNHLSNLNFCKQLVLNYLGNADKYKKIAKILDATGVVFDESIAIALYDFTFNSGGAFGRTKNQAFADALKYAGADKKKKANAYFRFRFGYVADSVGRTSQQYKNNKNGWARRYYHNAKKIEGINLNYDKLTATQAITGAFIDYGFIV